MAAARLLTGGVRLVDLDPASAQRWDGFVRQHPEATPYHLSPWAEILEASHRFKPLYLMLDGPRGETDGILPLVYRRGPVSGAQLMSLPGEIPVAGPLGRSVENEIALLEAACELLRSSDAQRLHLRSRKEGYDRMVPRLDVQSGWPSWLVELPDEPDEFWARFTGRAGNLRRDVTKALKSGVSVREARSMRDLRLFYRLYLRTMRKHGTLPRPLRQFVLSWRLLRPLGVLKVFVAEYEGRPVAGGLFHFFRDTVEIQYSASDERYLHVRPNHAVYAEVIRTAIEQGCRRFDFGATRMGSTLADFKRRWGAQPVPRFHYGSPPSRPAPGGPSAGVRARSRWRRSAAVTGAWERTPLTLTRLGGTLVHRYL